MHIYAYNTLGYHHLFRSQTLAIIDYLMQWPIYLHELCVCMCLCVCERVWKPTTNKFFTDMVLGISSIKFAWRKVVIHANYHAGRWRTWTTSSNKSDWISSPSHPTPGDKVPSVSLHIPVGCTTTSSVHFRTPFPDRYVSRGAFRISK